MSDPTSVLILNPGFFQVDVPYVSAQESPRIYVGDATDSFSGIERNSIRAVKRTFTVTTGNLDASTAASVLTVIGNAAQIPCQGILFNNAGVSVTCSLLLQSQTAVQGTAPVVWQLVMTVKFVAPV